MIRRNVKRRKQAMVRVPRPIVGLIIVAASLAMCYVWLDSRCNSLCREIKDCEDRKAALTRQYLNEEYLWQQLKAPENVHARLLQWRIPMGWPAPNQIVRMSEDEVRMAGRWDMGAGVPRYAQVGAKKTQIHD